MTSEIFNNILQQAKEQHGSLGNQEQTTNTNQDQKIDTKQDSKIDTNQDQTQNTNENIDNNFDVFAEERLSKANQIIKNRMIASVGVGMIPLPVVDITALIGLQMDTVRALSQLYGVQFTEELGRSSIASLTCSLFPISTGNFLSSLLKSVPVLGQIISTCFMPVIAGASTYAIGKVFVQHFESGGTFLTFDPKKVKGYFNEEYERGKAFAKS